MLPTAKPDTFNVEDGDLVRAMTTVTGIDMVHRCPLLLYQQLAYEMQEIDSQPFTLTAVVKHMQDVRHMPVELSQASVVIAFLKARGCLEHVGDTRYRPANAFLFDEAMNEYHNLRQCGPPV